MNLALFDLDNTLLGGDSDHSWGLYLCEVGAVDANYHQKKQDEFYQQYQQGILDTDEFLRFQLKTLTQFSTAQLHQWREDFIQKKIKPLISQGKPDLLEKHRSLNHKIIIITATNDFITRPIANLLEVETLIAPNVEIINNTYTGKIQGSHCYGTGKVNKLKQWLSNTDYTLQDSWFYSDSITDLPLLGIVTHPVAVRPDKKLRQLALDRHWNIMD